MEHIFGFIGAAIYLVSFFNNREPLHVSALLACLAIYAFIAAFWRMCWKLLSKAEG